MQIILPMSGFGERFRRAGFAIPKPLIFTNGKPFIAHVVDMFPGESRILFVCNKEHLENGEYRMKELLRHYCPQGEIIGIAPHHLGPVHAVREVSERLSAEEPVIVNYCDCCVCWNYDHFKQFITDTACDGAIPAYRGFHPHVLRSANHAYLRTTDGWVYEVQEKKPFTDLPMQEFASSGTYYFRTARLMREAFDEVVRRDMNVAGEFYVSLAYKALVEWAMRVAVYEVKYFMNWGTPEDFAEFSAVSGMFDQLLDARLATRPRQDGTMMMPMAGLGRRFAAAGYDVPKPLTPIDGQPMAVQAADCLPMAPRCIFVLRSNMPGREAVIQALRKAYPAAETVMLEGETDGQARTCLIAMKDVPLDEPLTIAACDSGAIYDARRFNDLMDDPETDVIVWATRNHPDAILHPNSYSWLQTKGDMITGISAKKPFHDPKNDPMIIGTFTFKRAIDFATTAERLIARDRRINNEFYVDCCIEDALETGLKCRILELKTFLCWGTPDDLRRFEYWQCCFHTWAGHPYRLEMDKRIPGEAVAELSSRCRLLTPSRPGPFEAL